MIAQLASVTPASSSTTRHEQKLTSLTTLQGQALKEAKALLTTLHLLFPHEFLPALDLLDRKLVTCLVVSPTKDDDTPRAAATNTEAEDAARDEQRFTWEVFYVRSASATRPSSSSLSTAARKPSRYRRVYDPSANFYEVRLDAWNCSCPAFTYSAFGRYLHLADGEIGGRQDQGQRGLEVKDLSGEWRFGGLSTKEETGAPICKHILAALLGRAVPVLFGTGVERKDATPTEAAGWGGGWGG